MKKILTILFTVMAMMAVMPVAMADYGYFYYDGETHYLPNEIWLIGARNGGLPFFLRTNPLVSGNSEQYLYGYGYGYFAGGYGYGYGFGYGYDYWNDYFIDWDHYGQFEKYGLGLGESYGEFKIPVTNGVSMALPAAMNFDAGDLGGGIILPAGLVMSATNSTWDGTLNVSADDDAGGIRGFGEDVITVNVDLGDNCDDCEIELSVPVVVALHREMQAGDIVKVETASGEYSVEPCDEEYNDEFEKDNPAAYDLEAGEDCYTNDDEYIYVATRHFSEFGAGEEADADAEAEVRGIFGYKKISRLKTVSSDVCTGSFASSEGGVMKTCEASNYVQIPMDFEDLAELSNTSWQYLAIQHMLDLKLFKGMFVNDRQVFNMNGNMTRGMAATVICRYMGCDEKAEVSAPFDDVSVHAYYASAVSYLKDQGVVEGKTVTLFDPDSSVTRAEFFKMLVKAYMILHPDVVDAWNELMSYDFDEVNVFADVTSGQWYAGYMVVGSTTGILEGYEENGKKYAKGDQNVTRVEAASMLSQMLAM
jgi:hypothetical protein